MTASPQRRLGALVLLATALCVATPGCADWRAPTRAVGLVVDDATLADSVRTRLAATRDLDPAGIEVRAAGGEVVLSGSTRTALAKSTAESVALKAPGVRAVRNEIWVRP